MAHCAPVEGRVIILEEKLGVCPAGIGETYWRLMANSFFQVTGPEDKEAYVMEQLCTGMEGETEGGIYYMQLLLQHHYQEDYWGIPIIDVSNVFNDENQTSMMWV